MSYRQRQRRRHRRNDAGRTLFKLFGALSALALAAVLAVVGYIIAIFATGPSLNELKPVSPGTSSVVYAADGSRLGFIQSDILRTPIAASQIPQSMRNATVAIEDQRFYHHRGVDLQGVMRAAVKNVVSGKTVQGGSTITMQL